MTPTLLCCVFGTFAMTGLIWLIQLVHYPLFVKVGADQFVAYEIAHSRQITPIVMPLMFAELLASLWLAWKPSAAGAFVAPQTVWVILAVMVLAIWLSTAVLQVPLHNQLEKGVDENAVRRLVSTNWIRTILWSARSIGLMWILLRVRS